LPIFRRNKPSPKIVGWPFDPAVTGCGQCDGRRYGDPRSEQEAGRRGADIRHVVKQKIDDGKVQDKDAVRPSSQSANVVVTGNCENSAAVAAAAVCTIVDLLMLRPRRVFV
jgi:hypothetical protein